MTPPNTFYSAALLTAGICCLVVGAMVLQRRPFTPGSIPLIVILFAMFWWDSTYGIFWAGTPAPNPYFWLDMSYVGVVIVPTAFLVFAMQLSGLDNWLKRPFLIGLCMEPLLVLVLMWTDPWHNLFFAGKRLQNTAMILEAGPVFWANVVYSYVLLLITFILLVRRFMTTSGIYRRQLGVVIAGAGVTWLNSFIFIAGLSPLPNADNTPFSFTIAAFAFAFALLRYRMFDIVPVARDTLIEGMSDGVIVLDTNKRIVDMNPQAESILAASSDGAIGKPVDEVFSRWADIVNALLEVNHTRVEVSVGNDSSTHLDLQISPLYDKKKNLIGRLVVWRDISHLKQIQKDLEKLATQDPLTFVHNRRHFYTLAEVEIERSIRYQSPLSIILVDIDYFKNINDNYGHKAGDEALIHFTQICRKNLRKVDIFARFGGEEFVILLPEADLNRAQETAERIRKIVEDTTLEIDGYQFKMTASFGVSTFKGKQDTLGLLLQKSDKALYAAKDKGRNMVVCVE
ncbi:MAG: diguanylate cyclase [Anaerolineales bacterium]|jgi:diguanylate cyclase (GGDEF)-like protein/PAS domain S-box-containing protein|nr:diguanylate cyclase [Anaerolineales bacterium]